MHCTFTLFVCFFRHLRNLTGHKHANKLLKHTSRWQKVVKLKNMWGKKNVWLNCKYLIYSKSAFSTYQTFRNKMQKYFPAAAPFQWPQYYFLFFKFEIKKKKVLNLKVLSGFSAFFKDNAGPIRPALTDTASRLWWHIRCCKDSWVQICVFAFPSVFIAFNHSPLSACTLPLMRHKMVLLSSMPTLERLFFNNMPRGVSDRGSLPMQLLWLSEGKASILPLSNLFSSWFAKRLLAWAFLWHS